MIKLGLFKVDILSKLEYKEQEVHSIQTRRQLIKLGGLIHKNIHAILNEQERENKIIIFSTK